MGLGRSSERFTEFNVAMSLIAPMLGISRGMVDLIARVSLSLLTAGMCLRDSPCPAHRIRSALSSPRSAKAGTASSV
jgi:hypothetical protein